MNIRLYNADKDFEKLKSWITDERTHAMWCAYRLPYPMTKENLEELLAKEKAYYNNTAYIVETDEGNTIGFYCVSLNKDESMLKFVITAPEMRGKGFGTKMIAHAVNDEFALRGVNTVRLCVFSCNKAARKCYSNVGFKEISQEDSAFCYKDEVWGRVNMEVKRVL